MPGVGNIACSCAQPHLCATKFPAYQTNQIATLGIFEGGISWPNPELREQTFHQGYSEWMFLPRPVCNFEADVLSTL